MSDALTIPRYIRRLTGKLIQMLAFVLHPEAVICLSNHVLHTPRFSFHRGPTWMTSITVGSWALTDVKRTPLKHGSVMADESIKLPAELVKAAKDSALTLPQSHLSFFVSSVVLTTTPSAISAGVL